MGGLGSGKPFGWGRPTCEDHHAIDIRSYQREGYLEPGKCCTTRWYRGDRETGSVLVIASEDCVFLLYGVGSGKPALVCQRIEMEYTLGHFGGRRAWFSCPSCGRRCAKLYLGCVIGCRVCLDLAYESHRENETQRALRRAQKLRMRLGGSANMTLPFPGRPKGMHWRTYQRLRGQSERDEAVWGSGIARKLSAAT